MYWCVATGEVPDQSGYLFGGLYNSLAVNPLTQARSCPNYYYPLRFGEDSHVCVSDDYELGYALSAPFAGFESCTAGNPLATKSSSGKLKRSFGKLDVDPNAWPHRCPTGYTQHLASMEQSCEVNYCVKAGTLESKGLPPIRLPPYHKYPSINPATYNVLSIVSSMGNLWIKDNTTGEWKKANTDSMPMINVENSSSYTVQSAQSTTPYGQHNSDKSPATVALIVSSTALIGLLIVVVVYGLYRYKGRKNKSVHCAQGISYENLEKSSPDVSTAVANN